MVDIETHRIIDLLDSRDKEPVTQWLKSFPNLKVVSRDGSHTYSSAFQKLIQTPFRSVTGSTC
ncbi:hypothetical protein REC12_00995 [Desulfosporosinus sp. PR]|uniref:hypothetical protein n=1 Tax=Candidatus Desulfosporosinus nitrosoreducens TaxID=3401928 RepID=UPI0027EE14DA|nr:hypothetical protein [Desulfosporosinus sp. PR]MDQ7092165.1 hypothetical protein [Desulfosporosinus sp. PR]